MKRKVNAHGGKRKSNESLFRHIYFLLLLPNTSLLAARAGMQTTERPFSQSEFRPFQLGSTEAEFRDTKPFTFLLPQKDMPLFLGIPSCVTLRSFDTEGEEVTRPYTPLDLSYDKGAFHISVKCYPNSTMGTYFTFA
ncbi:putative NADH-cytochrome b5 reductase [Trypanosoma conorhini]|uniref:Putative NADH-cytochrome b5 reductase n=1 Tax=Trypanosoma conorhini TaxID=83891 RepID=A0A422NWP3_9TRYP|nr:putative NADH-cytochrome b5 reductase [Trypanosoma conorhini]RNF09932.1 putative NADH-cytochrome b5 reductase [Trypanosoma conorhini]